MSLSCSCGTSSSIMSAKNVCCRTLVVGAFKARILMLAGAFQFSECARIISLAASPLKFDEFAGDSCFTS